MVSFRLKLTMRTDNDLSLSTHYWQKMLPVWAKNKHQLKFKKKKHVASFKRSLIYTHIFFIPFLIKLIYVCIYLVSILVGFLKYIWVFYAIIHRGGGQWIDLQPGLRKWKGDGQERGSDLILGCWLTWGEISLLGHLHPLDFILNDPIMVQIKKETFGGKQKKYHECVMTMHSCCQTCCLADLNDPTQHTRFFYLSKKSTYEMFVKTKMCFLCFQWIWFCYGGSDSDRFLLYWHN